MSEQTQYKKKLSTAHIWALGVGVVIADGIFIVSGQAIEVAGPASSIAYLLAGVGVIVVLLALGNMAVGMPSAGALGEWGKRLLNPTMGFMIGMGYLLFYIVLTGVVGYSPGVIFTYFYQIGPTPEISQLAWGVIWLSVFLGVNLGDVGKLGLVELVIAIFAVVGCVLFAAIAFTKFDPANMTPFALNGFKGITMATAAAVYAYLGPVALVTTGSEAKEPKAVPRALIWAGVTFTVMYMAVIISIVGIFPQAELGYVSPMTLAFETVFGIYAGFAMNAFIVFPVLGSTLCIIYAGARMLKGFADGGLLPGVFSKTNRHGTPYVGVIFQYVAGIILTAWATWEAGMDVYWGFVVTGCILALFSWVLLVVCGGIYPRKFPDEFNNLDWHIPGERTVVPALAIAYSIYALFCVVRDNGMAALYAAIALVLAFLWYKVYPRWREGRSRR